MSGDMVMGGEFERVMAEAADKERKAAYAAGWRDCLASISKAIADSRPGDLPQIELAADDRREREEQPSAVGNLPAVGTIPHYVLSAVKRNPGSSGADIIAAIRDDGHKFAEPQIRTALARLENRNGLIVNRHKKWFPK
jgi:hypothetical protein